MDIENLDKYFDGYELNIFLLCPRCHSDNIKAMEVPTMDGHFEVRQRLVWQCGECWNEFDEPLEE